MEENEFIPVDHTKTKKRTTKKSSSTKKSSKSKKSKSFMSKIDLNKVATIIGSFLLMFSIFLFIACLSYLFTWQEDQDKLVNTSFIDFIFNQPEVEINNKLGKFGAWMSHLLFFHLFGIASMGICFLMFLLGFKILFKKALVHSGKAFSTTIAFMLWSSVFLAFFSNEIHILGGTFGYYVNHWLLQTFGTIGALSFNIVVLYIIITLLFNPDYRALFNYFFPKKEKNLNTSQSQEAIEVDNDNMLVINPITEEDITEDIVSKPVDFSEENEASNNESVPPIEMDKNEKQNEEDKDQEL